ncbi:MAG: hypothetical protein ACRC33_04190, partial [Gemmataceae bacterium]
KGRGPRTTPLAALLLDDGDVGLGDWGPMVQATVNRQLAAGELMHLADAPARPGTPRVPILLVGNDLNRLCGPLRRAGRMRLLHWEPTPEEKAGVVAQLFPALTGPEVSALCRHFPAKPVAFFAALRLRCREGAWRRLGDRPSWAATLRLAARGRLAPPPDGFVPLEELVRAGVELGRGSELPDHLLKEVP